MSGTTEAGRKQSEIVVIREEVKRVGVAASQGIRDSAARKTEAFFLRTDNSSCVMLKGPDRNRSGS